MSNLKHYKDLILVLTQKEIKVRYKSTVLGYLWSVAHPLAFAIVFFIAFKAILRIPVENYALFLIAGLFPWQWFSNAVSASPMVLLGNASLIKKINFPRNIIPFAMIVQEMIHFLLSIPVIVLFMFIYHQHPSWSWLYGIPALLCIQFLMTYGLALIVSSVNLFFRDLERFTAIFLMLLFYCTPIIYPETMIPDKYQHLAYLNPVFALMVSWRNLFLKGSLEMHFLLVSLCYSLVSVSVGYWVFRKLSRRFAEVL
jgi:lipopolysaccharide transport system permease protein